MAHNNNTHPGRTNRAVSKEISKAVREAMKRMDLTSSDLALTLGQSCSAISRKTRGLTTWSMEDLDKLEETYGKGFIGNLPQIAAQVEASAPPPKERPAPQMPSIYGDPRVNAVANPRIPVSVFLESYGVLLNEQALKAAERCQATFPDDLRTAPDWMHILVMVLPPRQEPPQKPARRPTNGCIELG